MKKLLIASLVLGMLIVFTGVASAQVWWQSTEITTTLTLTGEKEITSTKNEVLATKTGEFKGFMIAESSSNEVPPATGAFPTVEEVFLCGTLAVTVSGVLTTYDVELDFPSAAAFAFVTSSYAKEPPKKAFEYDLGDVIATGVFTDQTDTLTGPVYFTGTITLKEDDTGTIDSVTVIGAVAGGYSQGDAAPAPALFRSPTINAVLKPYTLPDGDTTVTCVKGVVTPGT